MATARRPNDSPRPQRRSLTSLLVTPRCRHRGRPAPPRPAAISRPSHHGVGNEGARPKPAPPEDTPSPHRSSARAASGIAGLGCRGSAPPGLPAPLPMGLHRRQRPPVAAPMMAAMQPETLGSLARPSAAGWRGAGRTSRQGWRARWRRRGIQRSGDRPDPGTGQSDAIKLLCQSTPLPRHRPHLAVASRCELPD